MFIAPSEVSLSYSVYGISLSSIVWAVDDYDKAILFFEHTVGEVLGITTMSDLIKYIDDDKHTPPSTWMLMIFGPIFCSAGNPAYGHHIQEDFLPDNSSIRDQDLAKHQTSWPAFDCLTSWQRSGIPPGLTLFFLPPNILVIY